MGAPPGEVQRQRFIGLNVDDDALGQRCVEPDVAGAVGLVGLRASSLVVWRICFETGERSDVESVRVLLDDHLADAVVERPEHDSELEVASALQAKAEDPAESLIVAVGTLRRPLLQPCWVVVPLCDLVVLVKRSR